MSVVAFRLDESARGHGLEQFGLTEVMIHSCARRAWAHSRGRSALAASSAPGSDLYQDITEDLAVVLSKYGWQPLSINGQQRIIHPDGLIAIAVSSAVNVAHPHPKKHPRTRPKGPATFDHLDDAVIPGQDAFDIGEFHGSEVLERELLKAPLWFLLHEDIDEELRLSLARPAQRNNQGSIVGFSREIPIESLRLDTDLDIFHNDDEDDGIDFEVTSIR